MRLPIVLTDPAQADLGDIWMFLADQSEALAHRTVNAILKELTILEMTPMLGRSREEFGRGLRSILYKQYVVFYRVQNDTIAIIRVLHGSRDLEAEFNLE